MSTINNKTNTPTSSQNNSRSPSPLSLSWTPNPLVFKKQKTESSDVLVNIPLDLSVARAIHNDDNLSTGSYQSFHSHTSFNNKPVKLILSDGDDTSITSNISSYFYKKFSSNETNDTQEKNAYTHFPINTEITPEIIHTQKTKRILTAEQKAEEAEKKRVKYKNLPPEQKQAIIAQKAGTISQSYPRTKSGRSRKKTCKV